MKKAELKELIKQSMLEVAPKKEPGAMTSEEEKMAADYEEEANKHALDSEEPLEEDILAEADRIVAEWNSKNLIEEGRYTDEGYVQMMGPEFDAAVKAIEKAWSEWKNASMTSPTMKLPAKQDLLNYFDMILD